MSDRLFVGDCREVLAGMEPCSVDAVVTDPPYELGFMGKGWDASGVAFDPETWRAVLRVLKPGGHLLAFGGTRTSHRMVCAIEDAGFEVRDSLVWLYGSGFPKSLDVSKALDKAAGAEREVVGSKFGLPGYSLTVGKGGLYGDGIGANGDGARECEISAPATEPARKWHGWGTALKPAHEPIVLARKPLVGTVAANVLEHGTGALNIDGCRIAGEKGVPASLSDSGALGWRTGGDMQRKGEQNGRWPANVLLDEEAAALLDAQSGTLTSGANPTRRGSDKFRGTYSPFEGQRECDPARGADSGGASRFFYVAKASRSERGEGNTHPTVKPLALMRYLVRLITPPGGLVLDPFTGSGTTWLACISEGFRFVGVEMLADHAAIARQRAYSLAGPMFAESA